MAWMITEDRNYKFPRYLIKEDGNTKGELISSHDGGWEVNLLMVPELQFRSEDRSRCVGYIRGVEATVNLYAKETGRDKKKA